MQGKFLGQFLLERGHITREQLLDAAQLSNQLRVKLGELAVVRGYMTQEQSTRVHQIQRFEDKKFGELAVDQGFLTGDQVEELLTRQREDCLMLGEALVEKGYLTSEALSKEMAAFEEEHGDVPEDISRLYKDEPNAEILEAFTDIVLKMFLRMADDPNFWPAGCHHDIAAAEGHDFTAAQSIHGAFYGVFCLSMTENILKRISESMIGEELPEIDELMLDGAAEFVNIIDGNVCSRLASGGEDIVIAPPYVCDNRQGRTFDLEKEASDGRLTITPLLHPESAAEIWVIDRSAEQQ
jgi:CheY-specific phosphatase CheX